MTKRVTECEGRCGSNFMVIPGLGDLSVTESTKTQTTDSLVKKMNDFDQL